MGVRLGQSYFFHVSVFICFQPQFPSYHYFVTDVKLIKFISTVLLGFHCFSSRAERQNEGVNQSIRHPALGVLIPTPRGQKLLAMIV